MCSVPRHLSVGTTSLSPRGARCARDPSPCATPLTFHGDRERRSMSAVTRPSTMRVAALQLGAPFGEAEANRERLVKAIEEIGRGSRPGRRPRVGDNRLRPRGFPTHRARVGRTGGGSNGGSTPTARRRSRCGADGGHPRGRRRWVDLRHGGGGATGWVGVCLPEVPPIPVGRGTFRRR